MTSQKTIFPHAINDLLYICVSQTLLITTSVKYHLLYIRIRMSLVMFSSVSTWILSKLNIVFRKSIIVVIYMFRRATFGFSLPLICRKWSLKRIPLLNNSTRGKLWVTRRSYAVPFLYFVLFSCQCVPHPLGVLMHILLLHDVISSFPPLSLVSMYPSM